MSIKSCFLYHLLQGKFTNFGFQEPSKFGRDTGFIKPGERMQDVTKIPWCKSLQLAPLCFYKNMIFPTQAEYSSLFPLILGWKYVCIILKLYLKKKEFVIFFLSTTSILYFSSEIMRGVHANANASVERRSRERRETRVGGLSNLVPLVTREVICVSRMFCSTDQEKRETARSLSFCGLFISSVWAIYHASMLSS